MGFTDTLKAALAKKQAAQHPDTENTPDSKIARPAPKPPVGANKPPKKVTGRGR